VSTYAISVLIGGFGEFGEFTVDSVKQTYVYIGFAGFTRQSVIIADLSATSELLVLCMCRCDLSINQSINQSSFKKARHNGGHYNIEEKEK